MLIKIILKICCCLSTGTFFFPSPSLRILQDAFETTGLDGIGGLKGGLGGGGRS